MRKKVKTFYWSEFLIMAVIMAAGIHWLIKNFGY